MQADIGTVWPVPWFGMGMTTMKRAIGTGKFPRKRWTELRSDESASVSLMFALAAVPAVMLVGVAIDLNRQTMYAATLQSAADQTALALTNKLRFDTNADSLRSAATKLLAVASTSSTPITLGELTLYNGNTKLCLTAQQSIPMLLSGRILSSTPTVGVQSCATAAGTGTYEIALVMDTTGSMGQYSKLATSQTAAKALIAKLNPSGATPIASFSIVPFSTSVNVGTKYADASWMDASAASSMHWSNFKRPAGAEWNPTSRFDLFTKMGATWKGCVEERPDPYLVTDTAATSATPDTLFVPYLWPDEGDVDGNGAAQLPGTDFGSGRRSNIYGSSNWDINDSQTLNNYLYDFGGSCAASNDLYEQADVADPISRGSGWTKVCKYKNVTGVSSSVGSKGPNKGCTPQALMTLTKDATALNAKIDALEASGNTNLLPGFMWGWRTISPNGPFTGESLAPKAYDAYANKKVIIFMTDGENNWNDTSSNYKSEYNALGYFANNRLSGYGGVTYPAPDGSVNSSGNTSSSNWRKQMDAALLAACTNAKNAGVIVYTIGISLYSAAIDQQGQSLLRACASDTKEAHAFIATTTEALNEVYTKIAGDLGQLRLIK
jgi:Flp pilus assembly protein TadG